MRRLFCPFLAAAVLAAAVLGGVDRASAAIRITISDGTTDKMFYSSSSTTALFATDLGTFDVILQTTVTNFPGSTSEGTLSNTINLSDDLDHSGSILPTLTVTTEVIANVAGLSSGFVTGATRTLVESQSLATFTLPAGAFLTASSDVSGMVAKPDMAGGTVQNTTTVNGTVIPSLAVGVNSHIDANVNADFNAPAGYTLSSEVVFAGGTVGVSGLVISATSGVTDTGANNLTPEPASLVVWGLGAAGLALVAARRGRGRAGA
ncbi:MAG TPA: hypothetical protein VMP01_27095 [Pirellulaceae bacterium]|nr:hypothetical protein [Pirellulaceae bacterium]